MIKNIILLVRGQWVLEFNTFLVNGSNKMISTSKIKKITANKKNRMEKGARVWIDGSNPHSKGEFFSRSE